MSASARAGSAALIVGPLLGLAGYAMLPTLSDDAAPLVHAVTVHPDAMVAGLTLQALGIAVLIGGMVWLAVTLIPAARRLAIAGGSPVSPVHF